MPEVELSEEQVSLLSAIAEASKAKRREFYVLSYSGGTLLDHPALTKGFEVYDPDLQALFDLGLLTITNYDSRTGNPSTFDISPSGRHVFTVIHSQTTPEETLEDELHRFIDGDRFRKRYAAAHERWAAASELLWAEDAAGHSSDVGHRCREALQEFAEVLCDGLPVQGESRKPDTVMRLRAALANARASLGDSTADMLDALLVYWGTVSDLVQRQEHAGAREGDALGWEDSRRVVFQTLVVMYEIDRALATP